ncbi:MAG: hypothetical protein KIS66_01415 [Fimbriimonadaceae bacterium]|nr:hypothetical protein [Fimbriimonadaceae bacterium]
MLKSCLSLLALSLALRSFGGEAVGVVTMGGRPVSNVAVWLVGEGRPASTKAMIDQRDRAFTPHVSVVPVGTTVRFPNSDQLFHNVFFLFNERTIDLGTYPRGQSRQYRFVEPGIARFLCRIHSEMNAYLVVVASRHYAVTDGQGRMRIKDVPPGEYTLKAWHESGATHEARVTIGNGESKLQIDLPRRQ